MGLPPRRIDLLTALTALTFAEAWPNRLRSQFGPVIADFIGRDDFIRNKRATGRPEISETWARSAIRPRMPLFEYRCAACDSQFELLIRGSAVPACPSCGTTSLERTLSRFAVSSPGTQQKNRATLGAQQRLDSQRAQKERSHDRHDHHDD